jgi:DNA-binding MarR family transcriptional regulator
MDTLQLEPSTAPASRPVAKSPMPDEFRELTQLIERLHRRFLDVLRTELDRLDIHDINPVQCLLLSNIGREEINVRNLMDRGYYQGSNASYNIKKLVEAGYLEQKRSPRDRRSTLLKVSERGLKLIERVRDLEARQAKAIGGLTAEGSIVGALKLMRRIERYWDDYIEGRA